MKIIDTLKAYIKFGTKFFCLTWEKMVECKRCHGKSEEKGQFGILGVSLYVSKGVLWSCLELSSYFDTTKNLQNDINIEFTIEVYASMYYWKHESKLQQHIMRNCVYQNHIILQLKLKKQLIYNYYATIPLEILCINK